MAKKRIVTSVLAIVLIMGLLAGCVQSGPGASGSTAQANNAAEDKADTGAAADQPADSKAEIDTSKVNTDIKGDLTFWAWGDYEQNGAVDFNKYYPNVKINWVMVPNFEEKLQATVASGSELPDVVFMEIGRRASEMAMDLWENLEEAPYSFDRSQVVDWAIPLMENQRKEIVSVQWDMCQCGLLYRRDLAKQYFGIEEPADMEKMFPDWDTVIAKGKEVSDKSGGKVKLFAGSDDVFQAMSSKVTEPLVVDKKITFRDSYLEVFTAIEKMVKDNALGMDVQFSPSWNTSFSNGSAIFWPCPTWFIPWTLKPNDKNGNDMYGLMNMPGGSSSWGGTAGAIPKAKPDDKKKLAWTWISWLALSNEGAKSFSRVNGVPTCYKPAAETPGFYGNSDPYFKGQNTIQKYLDMENIIIPPMTDYDQTIENSALSSLRALDQGQSAQQAFDVLMTELKTKAPDLKE